MITFPVMFEATKVVVTSHAELLEVVRTKVGNPRLVLSMVLKGTPLSLLAFVDPTVESPGCDCGCGDCECGCDWDCECEAPATPDNAYSVEMVAAC